MIAIGVTGTDTGVGKTVVSCALAAGLAGHGARVGVMKPVETGIVADNDQRDARRLARAARSNDAASLICPYTFSAPLAPMLAARQVGATIDQGVLDQAFHEVASGRDVIIVEGAGGLLVPITRQCDFATLFGRWELGLVIVAANRLGVVNHVLLTLHAARTAALNVAAIVLNPAAGPVPPDESASTNAALLSELVDEVPVLQFPWVDEVDDHQLLARAAA